MVRLVNRVCDCGFVLERKRRIQPRIAGLILTHFNYGLGVVNRGPWVTQTKNFAGAGNGRVPSLEASRDRRLDHLKDYSSRQGHAIDVKPAVNASDAMRLVKQAMKVFRRNGS